MTSLQTLLALSSVALVTGCAVPGGPGNPPSMAAKADEHAAHRSADAAAAPTPAMEERMKAMREMRDKMAKAKTPEERQTLMADHMKAMHEGMQMMKGSGGMGGAGMAESKGMHADMAKRQQMMEGRMDMMQTMMEMMMQRMPGPAPK